MNISGPILALDISTCTGYAIGRAGEVPRSASVRLKNSDEEVAIAFGNFIAWLQLKIKTERPHLMVKEAPLRLGGFFKAMNSEANVKMQFGLHAIADGMALRFGIPARDVRAGEVRKHFIGRARCADRQSTKLEVIKRCHLLGLMPRHVFDDNRADALAVHDWACTVYGRLSAISQDDTYDGERDVWESVSEAYSAIRDRMSAGGPGWEPKEK